MCAGVGACIVWTPAVCYVTANIVASWGFIVTRPFLRERVAVALVIYWGSLALLVLITFQLWRRARRHPPGRCQECAYDLTGNVSGVCPECGTKIEAFGGGGG